MTEDKVKEAIETICMVHLDDEVTFEFVSIALIRKDDNYGGFCVRLNAVYDTIVAPLSIDITTGDVITPAAVQYEFTGVFDNGFHIRLWCYNIETVMAEKVETILRRNVFSTRPRDYYDVYILAETQKYDKSLFKEALQRLYLILIKLYLCCIKVMNKKIHGISIERNFHMRKILHMNKY